MAGKIVLLEFVDEAVDYVDQSSRTGSDTSQDIVVALYPRVASWLKRKGIAYVDSQLYIDRNSHARSLRKSQKLLEWISKRFYIKDDLGIQEAYSNALLWYARLLIQHLLWACELLNNVRTIHPRESIQACLGSANSDCGPRIDESEKYLGTLAEQLSLQQEIKFYPINCRTDSSSHHLSVASKARYIKDIVYTLTACMHRMALRKMSQNRLMLCLSTTYGMDALVTKARQDCPELGWAVVGERANGRSWRPLEMLQLLIRVITGSTTGFKKSQYSAEVWPQVLAKGQHVDTLFADHLKLKLDTLADEIINDPQIFSHHGISFARIVADKIKSGIADALVSQNKEIKAYDELLELMRPRFILTPFGRRGLHGMGQLANNRGIPGLLVSHGSFVPPLEELDRIGWDNHSSGMIYGSYSHSALQSPLAESFVNSSKATSEFIRTGPLSWGSKINRGSTPKKSVDILEMMTGRRVITHASTTKYRSSTTFHVFETPDEYLQSIKDLIAAVDQIPDSFLIVKFRPRESLFTLEDLKSLLPISDNYYISVDESFLDVLVVTDLLVSFSSTTIEEALHNHVPVLLYGGQGRYQHLMSFEVEEGKDIQKTAVYSIRHSEYLSSGLERILDEVANASLPASFFDQYYYQGKDMIPFDQVIRMLVN